MSKELTPIEDQTLDALLAELHGRPAPDLSRAIFDLLRSEPDLGEFDSVGMKPELKKIQAISNFNEGPRNTPRSGRPKSTRKSSRDLTTVLWTVSAIASAVLIFVWFGRDGELQLAKPTYEGSTLDHNPLTSAAPESPEVLPKAHQAQPVASPPSHKTKKKPRILVASDEPRSDKTSSDPEKFNSGSTESLNSHNERKVIQSNDREFKTVQLVSKQVDSNLVDYWASIALEPTPEATNNEVAAKLTAVLGVNVPYDAFESAGTFENFIRKKHISTHAAHQYLRIITESGIEHVDATSRDSLIDELSACFRGENSFDDLIGDWINGEGKNSIHWYSANSHNGTTSMLRRLASVTMNVDLRCVQCHDSLIESRGTQSEYWAFSGLLTRAVQHKDQSVIAVDPKRNSDELVFYDTQDGRKKVTEAGVPASWLSSTGDSAATDLKQWSERLIGSRELARGVVNSIWKMAYGRPLRGSVVDVMTPPHTESLGSLEQRLVDDLIASRFDLGRTLSLVVSAPTMRRTVPESLHPDKIEFASKEEIEHGRILIGSFAATAPIRSSLSVAKRIDFASRSINVDIDSIRNATPLLAQAVETENKAGKPHSIAKNANVTIELFPSHAESPPVHWLTLLSELEDQVDHIGYLVPIDRVPENIKGVIKQMKSSGTDEALILHRVWWMIHP